MDRRRRTAVAMLSALILGGAVAATAAAGNGGERTYRVTIVNLTGGQPLTPPLLALHGPQANVFTVGAPASFGVKEIAENGNGGPLTTALSGARGVGAVANGAMPIVPLGSPGQVDLGFSNVGTFVVDAPASANRLSWVSMLICTNDGFTGVDAIRLPRGLGHTTSALTAGYDAGTEVNTEAFGDIVPPCQGLIGETGDPGTGTSDPTLAEGGVIAHHPGIAGTGDLSPSIHGWDDPVALIVVERIG